MPPTEPVFVRVKKIEIPTPPVRFVTVKTSTTPPTEVTAEGEVTL